MDRKLIYDIEQERCVERFIWTNGIRSFNNFRNEKYGLILITCVVWIAECETPARLAANSRFFGCTCSFTPFERITGRDDPTLAIWFNWKDKNGIDWLGYIA